jgi:flagellar basal-body rod protein FlgB
MALDAASVRHQVIANNIANADTPLYRARVVNFESTLKDALMPDPDELVGRRTRAQHIPIGPEPLGQVDPIVTTSPAVAWRVDGNTVDIDLEVSQLARNEGMYRAESRLVNEYHRQLRMAIGGGGG